MSPSTWRFLIFGILGIFGEVIFTALLSIFKTRRLRLHGYSFIWMFPLYGLLAFVFQPVHHAIASYGILMRGLLYMLGIYLVEFVAGTALTALTGGHIWEYHDRFNYKGQITLSYVPVWFTLGLALEKYYPTLEKLGRILSANL